MAVKSGWGTGGISGLLRAAPPRQAVQSSGEASLTAPLPGQTKRWCQKVPDRAGNHEKWLGPGRRLFRRRRCCAAGQPSSRPQATRAEGSASVVTGQPSWGLFWSPASAAWPRLCGYSEAYACVAGRRFAVVTDCRRLRFIRAHRRGQPSASSALLAALSRGVSGSSLGV